MRRSATIGLFLAAAPLAAQTAAPLDKAAATITALDVARRIGVIADDSMMGRDTPSKGLDRTAQYVAEQFQKFGLRPGGDNASWFQRYAITRRRLDLERSRVTFSAGGAESRASFRTAARLVLGTVPDKAVSGPVVLVSGPISARGVEKLNVAGKVVLLPFGTAYLSRPGVEEGTLALYGARPKALLLLADVDSTTFTQKIPTRAPERTVIGGAD
jgi:hypothetical protein